MYAASVLTPMFHVLRALDGLRSTAVSCPNLSLTPQLVLRLQAHVLSTTRGTIPLHSDQDLRETVEAACKNHRIRHNLWFLLHF